MVKRASWGLWMSSILAIIVAVIVSFVDRVLTVLTPVPRKQSAGHSDLGLALLADAATARRAENSRR